jgi:hypothetical protein
MDNNAMLQALNQLSLTIQGRNVSEDDIEKAFVDIYRTLGYSLAGRDYRNKPRDVSGVPDVILHNSDRSIQVIVELKKPSEKLDAHIQQLGNYLLSLREARWGLLSNGKVWRAYQREGQSIDLVWESDLENIIADHKCLEVFERQNIEVTNFEQVETRLKAAYREGLTPKGMDGDLATEEFLFAFGLAQGSAFTALVAAVQDLLNNLESESDFVRGAFDFWKKVYARKIASDNIPQSWKNSQVSIVENEEGLYRFSYALETAYTLTARLILAKAIQDKDVTHSVTQTNLAERLLEHLKTKRNLRTNVLPPESYLEATSSVFDDYAKTLFTSIYAKDIFDWWRDYPKAKPSTSNNFAKAVADLEMALLRFDFRVLEGDLLGEMYQRYFDAETRKALGEFYTPKAVVDFILDEVGYDGSGTLLDPATGSGTFLVSALRRYLKKHAQKDPVQTLRGITEEFKLVAFDVNPFAVIMAQIGFASELLPLYAKAIAKEPKFVLRRLPIVRTDSLRKEIIEGEQRESGGVLELAFEEKDIKAKLELPVKVGTEFLSVEVEFPRLETAKQDNMVGNVRQWLQALQSVFAAVEVLSQAKDKNDPLPNLEHELRLQVAIQHSQPDKLVAYLLPYAQKVWNTLLDLKVNHGDGRFLKTLEDLMLGLVLKHYMRYGYVVGNPPYVRIQNLPEVLRHYWETRYTWAEKNFDIFVPFIERALHGEFNQTTEESCWLEAGGRLGFIVPNRFGNVEYASTLRTMLPETATVLSITDFKAIKFKPDPKRPAESIFADASVYPAILIAENTTPTSPYTFRATRMYPTEASISPTEALKSIRQANATTGSTCLLAGKKEYADVFWQASQSLTPQGWYLMPTTERAVFDKLQAIAASKDLNLPQHTDQQRRLENYTTTSSGGFQGISTALDDVMVLKELERDEKQGLILVYPKGGTPSDAVWLEQAVLRPFLFGRDVKRWNIGWDNWWVIFPYFRHQDAILYIPCTDYWDFEIKVGKGKSTVKRRVFDDKKYPDSCPMLDTKYPKLWAYLKQHEIALRGRESNRFKIGKAEEWKWYDLAYARSRNEALAPKILGQLLSSKAQFTVEPVGNLLFQGGGKGGGVYGISPVAKIKSDFLIGLLNSNVLDFLVRQISSPYAGGFYSYADAFLRDLPIPETTTVDQNKVIELSNSLTSLATQTRDLEKDIAAFPESVTTARRVAGAVPDLDSLENLLAGSGGLTTEIRFDPRTSIAQDLLGQWVLTIPRGKTSSEFRSDNQSLLELLRLCLEKRGKFAKSELLDLRLPEREAAQKSYIQTLADWQTTLETLQAQIHQLESDLNDVVYTIFGISTQERKIIEEFLARF